MLQRIANFIYSKVKKNKDNKLIFNFWINVGLTYNSVCQKLNIYLK